MVNDRLLSGSLAMQIKWAESDPDVVMVSSQHEWWDGTSRRIAHVADPKSVSRYVGVESAVAFRNGIDPFWALNGLLFRTSSARDAGLSFREDLPYGADKYFCVQLAQRGTTIFLATPTYLFNTSAAGRFHYAGVDVSRLFAETEELYDEVDRILLSRRHPPVPRALRMADVFLYAIGTQRDALLRGAVVLLKRPAVLLAVAFRLTVRGIRALIPDYARRWKRRLSRH